MMMKCSLFGEAMAFGSCLAAKAGGEELEVRVEQLEEAQALEAEQATEDEKVASAEVEAAPEKEAPGDEGSERSTALGEELASEAATSADDLPSVASPQDLAPVRSAGPAEQLHERLAELLASDAGARGTVECFGGYQTCFGRFLKSCKNNVDAAEKKLRKTFAFREAAGVNSLLEDTDALRLYEKMCVVWPEVIVGSTSDGSPVSYFDVKKAVKFLKAGFSEEEIRTCWLVSMERSLLLQREGHSSDAQGMMPAVVCVYNLAGLSLWQLSSCLPGLQQFVRVIALAEEHYPQNLRKAVVINVPSVFGKMVWPLVQKALDAETSSNVCVTSSGYEKLAAKQLGFSPQELSKLLKDVA